LRLAFADIDMTASRMRDGKYTFMQVVQGGMRFTAERVEPGSGEQDSSGVVGDFYSEELDVTYSFFEGDTGLMLRGPLGQPRAVLLGDNDEIRTTFGTLILQREAGEVVGFTLEAGRASGMVFERVAGGG
jgi:hypothetical protein